MSLTDQLALQRLGRQLGVQVWTTQPDLPRPVANRADRRRTRRTEGARP